MQEVSVLQKTNPCHLILTLTEEQTSPFGDHRMEFGIRYEAVMILFPPCSSGKAAIWHYVQTQYRNNLAARKERLKLFLSFIVKLL